MGKKEIILGEISAEWLVVCFIVGHRGSMRAPLRHFVVPGWGMTLTAGVAAGLLRPGVSLLRSFGMLVCGK